MLLKAYRKFIVGLDHVLTWVYIRKFEVFGKENVPLEGPLILASNHLNNADPPMIVLASPRQPIFMAKQEMIDWPILGWFLKTYGAFPVRRGEADLAALRGASEVVKNGGMLVMFPEGTRSRTGAMTPGHPGTGLLALRTGAPVLPVAITGTYGPSWPWILLKPRAIKHVTVTIGEPFHVPPAKRVNSAAAVEATDFIMRRIAALLPPELRGVYANEQPAEAPVVGAAPETHDSSARTRS
jgi:1-acyl-sn-glycerol-3-phosphate acyltransferase